MQCGILFASDILHQIQKLTILFPLEMELTDWYCTKQLKLVTVNFDLVN